MMYAPLFLILLLIPSYADLCADKTTNISVFISGNYMQVNITHWLDGTFRTFTGDSGGDHHFVIPLVHWDNRVGFAYVHRRSPNFPLGENCINAPRVLTGMGVHRICGGGNNAQHDIFLLDSGRSLVVNNCNVNFKNLTALTGTGSTINWIYNTYNMSGRLGLNQCNFS
ncbi:MAG: hypothetical protein QXI93_05420, partial [Candidatus Methanomethylicia archaeon]